MIDKEIETKAFNDAKDAMANMVEDLRAKQGALDAFGKTVMEEGFRAFFKLAPEVSHVTWTQYQPYFSDGDATRFSVNDYYFKLWPNVTGSSNPDTEDFEEDEDTYDGEDGYTRYDFEYNEELKVRLGARAGGIEEACDILAEVFKIPDSVFEKAFGDGVKVIANRSGITAEEYEHD